MTGKLTKKGRNPGAVDNWLDTLGLYRKNVAYDETCLFRAASEQLFDCQVYHERVRRECVDYARKNFHEFIHLVENEETWHEHINLLEKHMVICGDLEINLISRMYRRDVIIFHASNQQIFDVTKRNLPNPILLCLMDEDHYDVVYKKEHIVTAGFCQSIIYKILYEDVFDIPNVDEIVNNMLYEKANSIVSSELLTEQKKSVDENDNIEMHDTNPISTNIAPFPFKVAKALDPTIYRNIEYDSWGEVRRELRLGDWYYGDDKLILGTKCILNDLNTGSIHDCYIQDILKNENKCVVYITKLAEKRLVNYTDLSPENDAKPWPLPYRFSKNLVINSVTTQLPPADKLKTLKKRSKDKRRTKSCSESSMGSNALTAPQEAVENISAYVGVPLQMQKANEVSNFKPQTEVVAEVAEPLNQSPLVDVLTPVTPDSHTYSNGRYMWEQPQWQVPYFPPTPDQYVWPQTPTTPQNPFNFELKPMVASAPVTPSVIPYHDPNYPYYYNYHVEPYSPYHWPSPGPDYSTQMIQEQSEISTEAVRSQGVLMHEQTYNSTDNIPSAPRSVAYAPHTPQPIDIYPPVMTIAPGTPVIYAPTVPEMSDVVLPTTPIPVYTPPADVQYVSPGPYMYPPPPTPPAAWYTHAVNSQGFIFPPVNNKK